MPLTNDYLKAEIQQARLALNRLRDECEKLEAMLIRLEAKVINPFERDNAIDVMDAHMDKHPAKPERAKDVAPVKCKHLYTKWGKWREAGEGPLTYTCLDCGMDLLHEYLKRRTRAKHPGESRQTEDVKPEEWEGIP